MITKKDLAYHALLLELDKIGSIRLKISDIIKRDATYTLNNNYLVIGGTDCKQLGDILADLLLLVPYKTKYGWVSYGVYLQALSVFEKEGNALTDYEIINLSGHSLGGGAALILALLLLDSGYYGTINIYTVGAVKCISSKTAEFMNFRLSTVSWRVRHRDIVPHLGWWSEPIHSTPREGDKRKHIFDWDIKEHVMY